MQEVKDVNGVKITTPPKIFSAIQEVMKKIEAIKKERNNTQEGFMFRGIDDVYNELHTHMAEVGVFTVPRSLERIETLYQSKFGAAMIRVAIKTEYDFYATDGSKFTAGPIYSEGNSTSDKASNKAIAFAHKYALLQVFCIPTKETKDGDSESLELDGRAPAKSSGPTKPAAGGKAKEPFKQLPGCVTEAQLKRMWAIQKESLEKTGHWTPDELKTFIQTKIKKASSKELTKKEYDNLIAVIQTKTPIEAFAEAST